MASAPTTDREFSTAEFFALAAFRSMCRRRLPIHVLFHGLMILMLILKDGRNRSYGIARRVLVKPLPVGFASFSSSMGRSPVS